MALYAISDLHLSEAVPKPMDIFGGVWENYSEKIENNLKNMLNEDDVLVIAGDVSWGINLAEALPDFKLLSSLPSKKLIVKGNHDLWWETVTKMKRVLKENGIHGIDFIYNNCFFYEDVALCGTRGWFYEEDQKAPDAKIFKRELIRLEASFMEAKSAGKNRIFAFIHYPPVYGSYRCDEIISLLCKYSVEKCFYGHLHSESQRQAFEGIHRGIEFRLISADYLNFKPMLVIS
ncbi:MAG: metallophosphoesterase [Bacillota bacterium]|nr:metallophosphoesterase [Bacillota bacterium]